MGRFLAQWGQRIGFWDGVAQNIDDSHVTPNNLSKIRDLALQVFEAGSKICNAKIVQKIFREPMFHCINFSRNIVALKIVVVNPPVKHYLKPAKNGPLTDKTWTADCEFLG